MEDVREEDFTIVVSPVTTDNGKIGQVVYTQVYCIIRKVN